MFHRQPVVGLGLQITGSLVSNRHNMSVVEVAQDSQVFFVWVLGDFRAIGLRPFHFLVVFRLAV
ncbi:MAG: hypothetical protein ACRC1K_24375, partial [Planctomycetia bacterium]